MTKSPRAVAREALRLAREALPAYSSPYSRRDFTQHQLFAVLAVKTFLKTDYRGVAERLSTPSLLPAARTFIKAASAVRRQTRGADYGDGCDDTCR